MTVSEAADKYDYEARTIRAAIMRGALPAQRMGARLYVFRERDFLAYQKRTGHESGRPTGSKDSRPRERKPRRPASEEQPP